MKSKKYFISLISIVFNVLFLVVILFALGSKIVTSKSLLLDKNDFYEKANTDYIVYGLSAEQEQEYLQLDNVKDIYSYYLYTTIVKTTNSSNELNVGIYSDEDVCNTAFAEERLIEKTEDVESPVYVDYYFAQSFNLNLSDSFEIKLGSNSVKVNIAAIYKTDYISNTHIMIYYDDFKEVIDNMFLVNFRNNYSNITVKDKKAFEEYLKDNYVPKAFMLTREDFASDIEYSIYLKDYLAVNYYDDDYITVCEQQNVADYLTETAMISKNSFIALIFIGAGILIFGIVVAIIYGARLKMVAKQSNDYKFYSRIHYVSMIASLVLGVLSFAIVPKDSMKVLIDVIDVYIILMPILICYVITVLISEAFKIFITYKLLK